MKALDATNCYLLSSPSMPFDHTQSLTLTVLNLKGGVGKTHASWLIASVAEERKTRTLLIDTDAQGNLTSSFLVASDAAPGVEQLFDRNQPRKKSTTCISVNSPNR